MKKRNIVSICLALCLVTVTMVGATFAYFQDQTADVVNTFTVGDVKISLTEPMWDQDEAKDLDPGAVVDKNPMISNTGKSDGYIVMEVTGMDRMNQQGFSATYDNLNWSKVDANGNPKETANFRLEDGYYVYKGGALKPGASTPALFEKVTLSEDATEFATAEYRIMGNFRDEKGLFSYEDANGKEIAENVGRQPSEFNSDGTPTVTYTINGIANQTFTSAAEAEKYIKENVKEDVGFKFDLTLQGYAIQTTFKDAEGKDLPFEPYTNWFKKLIFE